MRNEKILVTTDFSELSQHAFEHAAHLAKIEGGEITLLTVIPEWPVPVEFYPQIAAPTRIEEFRTELSQNAKKRLDEFASKFGGVKIKTDVVQTANDVGSEICRYAEQSKCDVIIMAAHGRGGLGSLLLGSTLQRVVKGAPCPVLVIPPRM